VNDKGYGRDFRRYPVSGLIRPTRKEWISAVDEFVILPGKISRAFSRIRFIVIDNDGREIRRESGSGSGAVMEPMNSRVLNERLSFSYYGICAPCPLTERIPGIME